MLFDPRAHEPLLDAPWDGAAIAAEIRAIARDADDALCGREWWPLPVPVGALFVCVGDLQKTCFVKRLA